MGQRMTWDDMKKMYPNEWLMITDFEIDEYGEIRQGVVERHASDMETVSLPPALMKDTAFRYTGESTFRGFRDNVVYNDAV